MSSVKSLSKMFEKGDASNKNSAVKDLVRRIDNKSQPTPSKPSPAKSAEEEVKAVPEESPVERSELSEFSPDITREEEEDDEVDESNLDQDDDEDAEVASNGTGPIIVDEIPQVPVTEETFQGVVDELEDP